MNLNFKNSKRIGIIIGIVLFIFLAVGVTYAVIAWRTTDYNVTLNSKCLVQANFTKSENISGEDLLLIQPQDEIYHNRITIKKGMVLSNFSVWKDTTSSCTIDGYLRIALNVTSLPSAYMENGDSTNALQYALFYYDPEEYPNFNSNDLDGETFNTLTKGYITSTGTKEIYYDEIPDNGNKKNYILAIYLDGRIVGNNASDTNFSASVEASIDQKHGSIPEMPIIMPPVNDINDYNGSPAYEIIEDNGINVVKLKEYYGTNPVVYVPEIYEINNVEYETRLDSRLLICEGCGSGGGGFTSPFKNNTTIEEVYLDKNLFVNTCINLFTGCTSLKSVPYIPSNVTDISGIFNGCTNLEGNIKIYSSDVTKVTNAFAGTVKNITVEVPEGSTTYDTFMADNNLPSNVTVVTY